MYEYVTVSASSYDPGSLAAKLTEKSAEGWEVVSIVPTGGDVTAFCRRAAGAVEPAAADTIVAPEPETSIEELAAAAAVEAAEPAPAFSAATAEPEPVVQPATTSPWAATTEAAPAPEPVVAQPVEPAAAYAPTAAAPAAQPVQPQPTQPQVPAGWYSDPSGRFELRYWDGNGWTEHVARGGQQSTDPPVA
jgi:hypothetical protein